MVTIRKSKDSRQITENNLVISGFISLASPGHRKRSGTGGVRMCHCPALVGSAISLVTESASSKLKGGWMVG